MRTPIATRLWAKVAWGPVEDCWEWTAAKGPLGYGRVWDGDKMVLAHRAAFALGDHGVEREAKKLAYKLDPGSVIRRSRPSYAVLDAA